MLRISQRTVERYVKDQIKKPRPDLAARLEREVKKRWQPQIRAKAREKAATTGGIVIDVHARLGYAGAPIDTTDEDRIRHLTVALPPQHAARLFDAQEAGAGDQQLQQIAAEALKEVYFQDGGRRAGSLREVQINDVLNPAYSPTRLPHYVFAGEAPLPRCGGIGRVESGSEPVSKIGRRHPHEAINALIRADGDADASTRSTVRIVGGQES
jgi:hypothetical protein